MTAWESRPLVWNAIAGKKVVAYRQGSQYDTSDTDVLELRFEDQTVLHIELDHYDYERATLNVTVTPTPEIQDGWFILSPAQEDA
jgi:hypothetical protein